MSGKSKELELIEIGRPAPQGSGDARFVRQKHRSRRSEVSRKKRRGCQNSIVKVGTVLCLVFICILLVSNSSALLTAAERIAGKIKGEQTGAEAFLNNQNSREEYPQELLELLEKNEETFDFVKNYPNRAEYQNQPIDLSKDYRAGEVPLLMQWDKRWGYDSYGDSSIGLAGCGPTCLTMAYLYLTEDTTMNPRKMAEFAYDKGYYTTEGTSWGLWTEGAAQLGLAGREISLDEAVIKRVLDDGGLVVCSMRPGDFTTTGHFIVLRGYDEKGFFVNDPNRHSTSEKQWEFETLQGQIKNLWSLAKSD